MDTILYPYRLTQQAEPSEGEDPNEGGHNMLVYAEMTRGRGMHKNPLAGCFRPYVVPGPGGVQIDGTVVLSRTAFLDDWLLPKLRQLNQLTDITAVQPTVVHNPWYKPDALRYNWSRAIHGTRDYGFKYQGLQNGNTEVVWTFEHEENPPTSYASNTWLTLSCKLSDGQTVFRVR
jgi:hypothetical protein